MIPLGLGALVGGGVLLCWMAAVGGAGPTAGAAESSVRAVRGDHNGTGRAGRVGELPAIVAREGKDLTAEQIQRLGPVTYSSMNAPFRQVIGNLSRALRLAMFVDRRLNPDRIVQLDLTGVPLPEALAKIAALVDGGATVLGPVVYFGPVDTARQLRTLCALRTQEAQRMPAKVRTSALVAKPLAWSALSTPGDIVRQLAAEAGLEIVGLDRVPHDLLAAVDLPALSWVDRLSLVVAQYGLTFQFAKGGRVVELVPIGGGPRIERSYPAGRDGAATLAKWKQLAPEADVTASGGRIVVRGLIEDHERLVPPRGSGSPPPTLGQQAYTLKMEGVPLDAFLTQLGEKLDLRIDLDEASLAAAGIKPDRALNVDVNNATLDELLRNALTPLGLEFHVRGTTVTVSVRAEAD